MNIAELTPEQRKRLTNALMRDWYILTDANAGRVKYNLMQFASSPVFNPTIPAIDNSPIPRLPDMKNQSVDEMIGMIERGQREREAQRYAETERMFNREETFRFAYVPFVIAELAWDYADTVIDMAYRVHNPATRRLSRAIRNARAEYNSLRHKYIDAESREREIKNGYVFEDATQHITSQLMADIRCDIQSEYPDLNDESRDLLLAVYQCHITSRALLLYLDRQTAQIEKRVGHRIGKMLPPSYYVMDKLIPEYIGDKPASDHFKQLMKQYINKFTAQIESVELNDTTEAPKQTTNKQQPPMTDIELFNKIQSVIAKFNTELNKNIKGNKAAGVRARKASLELEKLMKQYRKQSIK
nr:MAG TPA: Histone H1-like protein Hc1 [Caudoviricetes sp.]